MVDSLDKVVVSSGIEFYFGIDIYAAKRIHQLHQGVEIDPNIILNLNSIEILKRTHRRMYAIDTCMGKLISLVSGYPGNLYKIITRVVVS